MQVLEKICRSAEVRGGQVAIHSRQGELSYYSLWEKSDRLASWLDSELKEDKKPIVVYGHKNPMMLVCFLACVKSGRAYCPVDTSMPEERIIDIVSAVENRLVLTTEETNLYPELEGQGYHITNLGEIERAIACSQAIPKDKWVKPEDLFYIIFTSGSTGKPKGVQVTSDNLSRFLDWSVSLGDLPKEKNGKVFLNQAPFSFDLSVMDTYTSLVSGGTLWCTDKELIKDTGQLLDYLEKGNINYWVSTPSFADMCMGDESFCQKNLKNLRAFFFCGERLTKNTAQRLYSRFEDSIVVNTYGPTESTVAITETVINHRMINADKELPIGVPKPGTTVRIIDKEGNHLPDGEKGEIQIIGDTVSLGYFMDKEKTDKVFGTICKEGKDLRTYRTGDEGYIQGGMLYYVGRLDKQVKLHGYRIELGDIEANLMEISGVEAAAVLPKTSQGRIRYLVGLIQHDTLAGEFQDRQIIRGELKERLPEYMVPKKILFLDRMPMNRNGKIDRGALEGLI